MDLASRIRARLAEGRTADDVVAQLIADGMSESNARRIVARVQASPTPEASLPNPADETIDDDDEERSEDPTGHGAMISGACFVSLGFGLLLVSALAEKPDPKFRITWGAILVGVVAMYRGLRRWDPQRCLFRRGDYSLRCCCRPDRSMECTHTFANRPPRSASLTRNAKSNAARKRRRHVSRQIWSASRPAASRP